MLVSPGGYAWELLHMKYLEWCPANTKPCVCADTVSRGFFGFEGTILSPWNGTFPYLANANWFSRTQFKQDPAASLI